MKLREVKIGVILSSASILCYAFYYFVYVAGRGEQLHAPHGITSAATEVDPQLIPTDNDSTKKLSSPDIEHAISVLSEADLQDPTVQKMVDIMESESFQQRYAQQTPDTFKGFVGIFAEFGIVDATELDVDSVIANGYEQTEAEYIANHGGKKPAEVEITMMLNLIDSIEKRGHKTAFGEFMGNGDSRTWFAAHFKGDEQASNNWLLLAASLAKTSMDATENTDSEFGQYPEVQMPDASSVPIGEAPGDRSASDSFIEELCCPPLQTMQPPAGNEMGTQEVDSQTNAGREKLSRQQRELAKRVFDRYGQEEGLRQLRRASPTVAESIGDASPYDPVSDVTGRPE